MYGPDPCLVASCGGDAEDDNAGAAVGGNQAFSAQAEPTLSAAAVQEFSTTQGIAARGTGTSPGQISIASRSVQRALASTIQPGRVSAQGEPFTDACTGGGKVTLEVSDDLVSFKASFEACVEDGETINGAVSLNLVSISDDGLLQTFEANLTGLSVTLDNLTAKLSGDLRMSLDARQAGKTITTFSSATQTLERSVGGQVQASRTLKNSEMVHTSADSGQLTDSFSFNSEGTLAALGAVAYKAETVTALGTPAGSTQPTSGQIKVTVDGKGIILLTIEATRVHVQADLQGDGSFEVDRFDTWAQLSGSL